MVMQRTNDLKTIFALVFVAVQQNGHALCDALKGLQA